MGSPTHTDAPSQQLDVEKLLASCRTTLAAVQALPDPMPLEAREQLLAASVLAQDLWVAAQDDAEPRQAEARRTATELTTAATRAMARWAKRVGRKPIDEHLEALEFNGEGRAGADRGREEHR